MALHTAFTGDQLTAIRSGKYQVLQYVCVVPNEVVVQFNPASAPSTAVYAEITPDTPLSGDMANVETEQTVIYSTTADYQATETFRSRVRKVSGTTTLYVGENSQSLTTSDFVTVLNTYEIQEKLRKSETYVDWDILFRKLLPIETALPSAVVLSNGVTAYSPTATPQEMDSSATSTFTHAWESSNSNDTLDSGGTTNNPTFTLEAGSFRWIRYTFTDSNSNVNFRVVPVWTVPKNYDNPYVVTGFIGDSGDVADVTFDAELGWSATVTAWNGIQDLINKTYIVIASDEWYNDTRQSIRTNIDFVGFLQNENTPTRGDENIGRLSETTFTVESFGSQLARQNIAPIRITRVSGTPTAWNQIQNPTPARMLTYHLTEGSTLFHLCSMTIPSDDTDFVGDDLSITGGKAYDDIRFITEVINAELQFDTNGKLDLCRNLNFLDDTARDAAPVIITLSPSDVLDYSIEYDYSKTTSQLTMNGGAYNSSRDEYDLYEAIAPAVARLGEGDPLEIGNQVLTTDSTEAEALVEISERSANFFAYNNPTPTLRATLKDELHCVIPDVGAWVKFDIVLTDTARGRTFGVNDRWQCVECSVSTNNESGRRAVTATFRHETQSTGAIIRARQIQNDVNADILYFPPVLPPFTGGDLGLTGDEWWDSMDVVSAPSDPTPPDEDCRLSGFRVPDGGVEVGSALNNEYIGVTVRGSGQIGISDWLYRWDFTDMESLPSEVTIRNDCGTTWGTLVNGTGITSNSGLLNNDCTLTARQVWIQFNLPSPTIPDGIETVRWKGSGSQGNSHDNMRWYVDDVEIYAESNVLSFYAGNEQFLNEVTWQPNNRLSLLVASAWNGSTAGSVTLEYVEMLGEGANPFTGESETVYGDAFYYWSDTIEPTPYPDGFGLLIEGFQPDAIPPYDPNHEYSLAPFQVASGPVLYEYEPYYGTSNLANWSLQIETCFLGANP